MMSEVKEAINQMGGLGEFKRQRSEEWDKLDEDLKIRLEKIRVNINDPCLRIGFNDLVLDLLALQKLKRRIDLEFIGEVENVSDSYEEIINKIFNNYLLLKKSSIPTIQEVLSK